ncbi:MAG: choice-of-anchor J domain-containing protein, partial [Bacteroidales bacterium]|nr:choice-of-anchor J domain-containing protein [Bacteroidales bacterium]
MTPPSVLQLADFVLDLDPFTAYNVAGSTKGWYHNDGEYAEINPYGSSEAEVDWLISPEFDLAGITGAAVSFKAAYKYGTNDDTHFLKMYYSEDFDGDSASIGTATWTELSFPVPEYDTWTEIEPIDVSAITGTAYFAFVYSYVDNYSRWSIDDAKVLGYAPAGTDATLSMIALNGVGVDGFEPARAMYTIELPAGDTVSIPRVTYYLSDENATAEMTEATDLDGDKGARTASIVVTAQDGTTQMEYSILFNKIIKLDDLAALRAYADIEIDRKFIVSSEVVLTHKDSYKNKKYFEDASAAIEIYDEDGII